MTFMKIMIYLQLSVCKGLLPSYPWTLFIIFFPKDPPAFFAFPTTLTKALSCDSLMKRQWWLSPKLNNSHFFSELLLLKVLNKFTIWLLLLFWDVWTQILKLNTCIFSCGRFQSSFLWNWSNQKTDTVDLTGVHFYVLVQHEALQTYQPYPRINSFW